MPLTPRETALLAALEDRQGPAEALLERLVAIPSYSDHAAGANQMADLMSDALGELGFRTSELVSGSVGRTVIGRRESGSSHRLLLIGHVDTVHPPSSPFRDYRVIDDDRATGPGAADMKGGLVVMLEALRALLRSGALEDRHVTVVINADEEIGSPHSADLIRSEAGESHLALCFEGGRPREDGSSTFVTARKGFGRMTLEATGKAAHAGVDPAKGASALLELCHKAVDLAALSDPGSGITVNVGVLNGGTTANTVAAKAELQLDYRFPDDEAQARAEEAIYDIAASNVIRNAAGSPLVATLMQGHVKRAAMKRSEAIGRMADRIRAAGEDLGLELVEEERGGSSDAALATEMGCPAVCGLGVVGDGFHTPDEWIVRKSLVERAGLVALTIDRFYGL